MVPPTLSVIPRVGAIVKLSVTRSRPLVVAPANVMALLAVVTGTAPRFASAEISTAPPPKLVMPPEIVLLPESTSVPPKTLVAPVVVLLPESVIVPVPSLVRAIWPVPVAIVPANVPPPALP